MRPANGFMTDMTMILKVGLVRTTADSADARKLVRQLEDPSIIEKTATLPRQPCTALLPEHLAFTHLL